MKINEYYLRELNSLRVLGEEFAIKNPGLAPYLSKEGQDPDVERMLEGFAFLTGRLRQQLDEQLPEVSHNLAELLWANYMRPIPSYCIIAYEPIKSQNVSEKIPKNTSVLSKIDQKNVQCKFKTSYETTVHPFELSQCKYFVHGQKSDLELDFTITTKGTLSLCSIETMRIFLNGTRVVSEELYFYFLEYVENVQLDILDENFISLHSTSLGNECIKPVGFKEDERLMTYPENVFDGYIALQEYFAFFHKYMFIDINGLNRICSISDDITSKSKAFRLKITFSNRFTIAQNLSKNNFMLYCTPIINIFDVDATPIRKNSHDEEYLLTSSEYPKENFEVFAVQNVKGWIPSKNSYENFKPFKAFNYTNQEEYYSVKIKLSDDKTRTNSYLRFGSSDGIIEQNDYSKATISVNLLATNRSLPVSLGLGNICISDPLSASAHLKFQNITIPSISYPPPIDGDFMWRMISNMSLNYLSLNDVSMLVSIISSYDFLGMYDTKIKNKNALMMEGLISLKYKKEEMIYEGFPIRGISVHLDLDVSKFTGIGEAYLFCNILNEFFALYGNINAYHRLEVKISEYGIFKWKPRLGQKQLV